MFLPYLVATMMLLKLSSSRMIPAASLATSVPVIPIDIPTLALLRAGASLVPSPVTATTFWHCLSPVTNKYLSSGVLLPMTLNYEAIYLNMSIFLTLYSPSETLSSPPTSCLNWGPSNTEYWFRRSLLVRIPASKEMAFAVFTLSPVTITTLIPAFWN